MPYSIDKYSSGTVAVIEDGTINNSLDIKLIGKNYAGYGEAQNENFVWLLENFAGTSAPARPITGQLWYDSYNSKLKVYNGTGFKNAGGIEVSSVQPIAKSNGEFWYDTANHKLWAWDSAGAGEYVLIGPQSAPGFGTTVMESATLISDVASGNVEYPVVKAVVNDTVVAIFSNNEFTLSTDSGLPANQYVPGFVQIKKGLTVSGVDQATGVSLTNYLFWGTASNSTRLNGVAASKFARTEYDSSDPTAGADFKILASFVDAGFRLGTGSDLEVSIDTDGTTPIFANLVSDSIKFKTTSGATTNTPLILVGKNIRPGYDNDTDLGSASFKYKDVYATNYYGLADTARTLYVNGGVGAAAYQFGALSAAANTIAARDSNGNITANTFLGTSSQASGLVVSGTFIPAADYVHVGSPTFTSTVTPVTYQDIGFRFGTSNKFRVTATSDTLLMQTTSGTPLTLKGLDVLPGSDVTSNIGSPTQQYKKIYAGDFYGTFNGALIGGVAANASHADHATLSDKADSVLVADNSNQYLPATVSKTEFTLAVRGASGVIAADLNGNATTATTAANADKLKANGVYKIASENGPSEIVVRRADGMVYGDITGNAATATWAASAGSAPSADASDTARIVTQAAQPAITSVGTMTGLTVSGPIVPNASGAINIGATGARFETVYASTFVGNLQGNATSATDAVNATNATTATRASTLLLTGSYVSASTSATANTIAARDSSGNLTAGVFNGVATSAKYADLAEKYLPDAVYEPGTVVVVGGTAEITASSRGLRAIGVISTAPAYMMNSELEGGVYVALKGRVPVKVIGSVTKGDRLVSADNGCAIVAPPPMDTFAIALETNAEPGVKVIEALIL